MTRAYQFKTEPMDHQLRGFKLSRNKKVFAYLMEQGTGKTKLTIDVAADLFERNEIDAVLVVAPSEGDVPFNWLEQIEEHLPNRIPRLASIWRSNMRAKERRRFEALLHPRPERILRFMTVNIEAVRAGASGFKAVSKFLKLVGLRAMLVVDESQRIRNPGAAQTKAMLRLGGWVEYRRILSGTPIVNGPLGAFSQFGFLDQAILGHTSYTAFKAHYCQMLPPEHGLVRHAVKVAAKGNEALERKLISIVQIPARDPNGRPVYKNLDELQRRIAPWSFRVLKRDCLDLPDKVYHRRYIELTPKQRAIYNLVREKVIAEFVHDRQLHRISAPLAINRLLRLSQVAANHFHPDPDLLDSEKIPERIERALKKEKSGAIISANPRAATMLSILEDHPEERGVIWARHHPEISEVVETLSLAYGKAAVVQLHGKMSKADQNESKSRFQDTSTPVRWMVGQVRSGIGIDLYAGSVAIYYTNSFSLEDRLQSEDREHRKGQKKTVNVYDIEAHDTIDAKIIDSLRAKREISDLVLKDDPTSWL